MLFSHGLRLWGLKLLLRLHVLRREDFQIDRYEVT